jgi:hypothetical protein
MTIVTGKHRELLIELLIYYLRTNGFNPVKMVEEMVIDIKEQNEYGEWYVNYYINDYGS